MTEYDVDIMLLNLLGSKELVDAWWLSPNKAFGDNEPEFIWHTNPLLVYNYIQQHLQAEGS